MNDPVDVVERRRVDGHELKSDEVPAQLVPLLHMTDSGLQRPDPVLRLEPDRVQGPGLEGPGALDERSAAAEISHPHGGFGNHRTAQTPHYFESNSLTSVRHARWHSRPRNGLS